MNNLTVSFSNDKMLAYITGTSSGNSSEDELVDVIYEALDKKGVVYGIQKKLVLTVAHELIEVKRVVDSIVAIGEYSKSQKLAGPRFTVATYLESVLDTSFLNNISKPLSFHKLINFIFNPVLVRENEVVGKFRSGEPGIIGCNIFGESVGEQIEIESSDELGQGLMQQYESDEILSTLSGVIIRKKNLTYILPVNIDGDVVINISKDKLKAYLHLYPPGPGGKDLTRQDIQKKIVEKGISYGIKTAAIDKAFNYFAKNNKKIDGELIAEGKPSMSGRDARIDYKVNISFSSKPGITENGNANYYSIHLFENVTEKQPLAKILPPTDGVVGIDICNNTIEATSGKDIDIIIGNNVEIMPGDPSVIISSKIGHVHFKNNSLYVEEVLKIYTDVDFHTGNIDFLGDIVIEGDVKSGFSVKAAGHISIKGTVEDAIVEAGDSVIIHAGFIGKGKGKIKAGGDVVVRHVRNQTIMARNNILIDGEVLDANLYAGNQMFVEIKKSWIVGGSAVARNCIRAFAIGNSSHAKTEVSAGIDLFVKKMLSELEKEIIDLENELNITSTNEEKLAITESGDQRTENEKNVVYEQLKNLREKHEKKINQLKKYTNHYKKSLYDNKGTVGVIDTIFPGVTINIGDIKHCVVDALKTCQFYIFKEQIRTRTFTE